MSGFRVLSAGTLTGDDIKNAAGEKLGTLKDVMLDIKSGRIAYGVLSFGGFMGLGDKLFAVPWTAMRVDQDDHCLILNVDKQRLAGAPGFDKDDWPDFANPAWHEETHKFYGATPYWS